MGCAERFAVEISSNTYCKRGNTSNLDYKIHESYMATQNRKKI